MERQLRKQEWRKKKRCESASHFNSIHVQIHRCANSVLRKLSAVAGNIYLAGMKYRVIHRHVGFHFIDDDHSFCPALPCVPDLD